MANIRCPMCGKDNPPEVEVCAYCGARLKPARPASPSEPEPGSEPDWLSSIRPDDESAASSGPASPDNDQPEGQPMDMPDWLARIRERARTEQPAGEEDAEAENTEPDWMQDLLGDPLPDLNEPERAAGSSAAGESLDDWLSRLPGGPGESDQGGLPQEPLEDENKIDGWLQSYPAQPAAPASGDDENWVSKLAAWQSDQDETDPLAGQPVDGSTFVPADEDEAPAGSGFGLTGFLSGMQDDPGQNAQSVEPLDWGQAPEPISSGVPEDEIPEWLRGEESSQVGGQPAPDMELPGWIASDDFSNSAQEPVPPQTQAGPGIPSEEAALPDWFSSISDASEPGAETSTPAESQAAGLPDWLQEEGAQAAGGAESAAPARDVEPAPEEEAPELDWLASFNQEIIQPEPQTEPADLILPATPEPEQAAGPEPFTAEETPDWLRDFANQDSTEEESISPLLGEEVPAAAENEFQAFASADLPDWLSEDRPVEGPSAETEPALEAAGEELAQADLPEWVKEMRPIEAVIPGDQVAADTSTLVEKSGPLAGLRGVLPAEDLAGRYRKPPVYSSKLRVTEKQRSQASLFESILAQETQPLLVAPERSNAPRFLARVIIALLFLVVLVGVRVFPFGIQPTLMLTPPELRDMFDQIDQNTQSNAPVLLAVDFEPGRAGEMAFASAPVIEHLMAKNSRIVVLSTVPTGPALAEQLLSDAARRLADQGQPAYDLSTQSINLGYLPGGTISLLEFAQMPSRAAPASITGDYGVWSDTFLQGVTGLDGFAEVIVMTDSAETGRAWVEQVGPAMGATPLLMVTSMQAAPLLMPFTQSGQIDGMASGLLGGELYSQWRQVETPARRYWESYQVGILLGLVVILAGGLFSGGAAVIKRKEKDGA